MWNLDPGQDQKARVIGNEADVPTAHFRAPADVAVTAAQMSRCRTPRQTRYRATLCPTNILQVFAHRLFIAEVVILLHQTIEQRLIGSASYLLELNPAERTQRHSQPRSV